ncbi:MAG: M48 family metallopeptidase [Clostridia bacterium]|nr:M48 family metallopeptidase [Clostridia bacterium]MDE7328912.1 M48 family metallopeptidase [Clostridia bacterium]
MVEKRSLAVGELIINYDFTRRKKMKNIRLRIAGDGTLCVSAPMRTPISEVERVVVKNVEWIKKATAKTVAQRPTEIKREYYTDEKFLYLGAERTLVVAQGRREGVEIQDDYIFLTVAKLDDFDRKKKLLDKWYRTQTEQILSQRFYAQVERFRALFPDEYALKIRSMVGRWGSCMITKKTVTLNSKLIYADASLIDFVILHELCHFKYKNHDKDFYTLLSRLCPRHKECRKALTNKIIYYSH